MKKAILFERPGERSEVGPSCGDKMFPYYGAFYPP